jgi:aryl-alcohol dehydrogenase (NADP+)
VSAAGERRTFGTTGLSVHPVCFGCNVLGWTVDRDEGFAVLDAYVEAGGNFLDTADGYAKWVPGNRGGESEEIIGAWLKARRPGGVVVATKVGGGSQDLERGLRREQVLAGCDASLRRLGVEAIDLYYAHFDDPDTPLEETLGAFDELVAAGKVRHVAASNHSAARLREALETSRRLGLAAYAGLQPKYNLVDRDDFDDELRALALEHELGVAVYTALASGFLTGKYAEGKVDSPRAGTVEARYLSDERALAALAAARNVAAAHGVPVAQVALAWALAQPAVTCVIASATAPGHVRELMSTVALELDPAELAELDEAGAPAGAPR